MGNTTEQFLFDPRRRRALEERSNQIRTADTEFLYREAVTSMAERIAVINREFNNCVDLFDITSTAASTFSSLHNCKTFISVSSVSGSQAQIVSDREILPLAPKSINLVTSVFGLHWNNNMTRALSQIRTALCDDGLFMCALPGPLTLQELRQCMLEAEAELYNSASLRVEPFGEVRQFGDLLQRAGFALPVADTDTITVRYCTLKSLITDLRAMGATLSTSARPRFAGRAFFDLTEEVYRNKFADDDGKIRATFQIVYLSGWAPDASQQKPLKPGTAEISLASVLSEKAED